MCIYIGARCSAESTGLTAAHNNSLLWGTYRYASAYYPRTAAHTNSLYIPGQLPVYTCADVRRHTLRRSSASLAP